MAALEFRDLAKIAVLAVPFAKPAGSRARARRSRYRSRPSSPVHLFAMPGTAQGRAARCLAPVAGLASATGDPRTRQNPRRWHRHAPTMLADERVVHKPHADAGFSYTWPPGVQGGDQGLQFAPPQHFERAAIERDYRGSRLSASVVTDRCPEKSMTLPPSQSRRALNSSASQPYPA